MPLENGDDDPLDGERDDELLLLVAEPLPSEPDVPVPPEPPGLPPPPLEPGVVPDELPPGGAEDPTPPDDDPVSPDEYELAGADPEIALLLVTAPELELGEPLDGTELPDEVTLDDDPDDGGGGGVEPLDPLGGGADEL